jgi:hypothetical protein
MTLNELTDAVSRIADTPKTQINAADVKRVVASTFDVLAMLSPADCAEVIGKGLKKAEARQPKC